MCDAVNPGKHVGVPSRAFCASGALAGRGSRPPKTSAAGQGASFAAAGFGQPPVVPRRPY